jgi:hypothetical protein
MAERSAFMDHVAARPKVQDALKADVQNSLLASSRW